MSKPHLSRVSFSLHPTIIGGLDTIADHLQCSRSAVVGQLLASALPAALEIIKALPDSGDSSPAAVRRFRGDSARIIGEQVGRLVSGGQDDLFK